jgi:hypothetical protein
MAKSHAHLLFCVPCECSDSKTARPPFAPKISLLTFGQYAVAKSQFCFTLLCILAVNEEQVMLHAPTT